MPIKAIIRPLITVAPAQMNQSQSSCVNVVKIRTKVSISQFICFIKSSVWGWYAVNSRLLIFRISHTRAQKWLTNYAPLSLIIAIKELQYQQNTRMKALTTVITSRLARGFIITDFVSLSVITIRLVYLFGPVGGSLTIKSINISDQIYQGIGSGFNKPRFFSRQIFALPYIS